MFVSVRACALAHSCVCMSICVRGRPRPYVGGCESECVCVCVPVRRARTHMCSSMIAIPVRGLMQHTVSEDHPSGRTALSETSSLQTSDIDPRQPDSDNSVPVGPAAFEMSSECMPQAAGPAPVAFGNHARSSMFKGSVLLVSFNFDGELK